VESFDYNHISYAMVDCVRKDKAGLPAGNLLFFVDVTNHKRIANFSNPLYQSFKEVTKRRIHLVRERRDNILLLFRIFLAEGVDEEHASDNYIEVIEITDVYATRVVEVIDRTTLHDTGLNIADYSFIRDELFLLNFERGLYVLSFTDHLRLEVKHKLGFEVSYHAFGYAFEHFYLATNYAVYTFNYWGLQVGKLALPPASTVTHLLANSRYLFVSAFSPFVNPGQDQAIYVHCTWAFQFGDRSYTQAQYSVDHLREATFQFVHGDGDLLIFDSEGYTSIGLTEPSLVVSPSKAGTASFTIRGTSSSFNDKSANCSVRIDVITKAPGDDSITELRKLEDQTGFIEAPDDIEIPLEGLHNGPWLDYSLADGDNLPKYSTSKNVRKGIVWINGPKLSDILFVDMLEDDPSKALPEQNDVIWVVVQLKNYSLYTLTCFDSEYTDNVTCLTESSRKGISTPISDISHSWVIYDSIRVIILAVVYENEPNTIYLLTAEGLTLHKIIEFGSGFGNQISAVTVHF
jgi:hypothetical protein